MFYQKVGLNITQLVLASPNVKETALLLQT